MVTVMLSPQRLVMSRQFAGQDAIAPPPVLPQSHTELSGRLGALVALVGQSPAEPQHWPRSWLYTAVHVPPLELVSVHWPSESAEVQTTSPAVGPVHVDVAQS
jgi:hypothetical protein